MKKLVVVIDMVEGFINFGNLSDPNINRIVPNVVSIIKTAIKNGDKLVSFKDTHDEDDIEFLIYPVHCVRGTAECNLVPELLPYENKMKVIEKSTTNGFDTPKFKELISKNTFDEICVCGCCTDICVSKFLESLHEYLVSSNKKTKIVVYGDAVDTFGGEGHNPDEINKKFLEDFKQKYGAEIRISKNQNALGL